MSKTDARVQQLLKLEASRGIPEVLAATSAVTLNRVHNARACGTKVWHASGEEESGAPPVKCRKRIRTKWASGLSFQAATDGTDLADAAFDRTPFPFVPWHVPRFLPSADPRPMFHPFRIEAGPG